MAYHSLFAHLVWSTKNRTPSLSAELQQELYPYLSSLVNLQKAQIVMVNGVTDHVHLLVRFPTHLSVADCVRTVKSNSSRWMNERSLNEPIYWQEKYAAFSVNPLEVERVKSYIARQKEHHHTETFQNEIRRTLREHGIEFDERYVWQ